MATQRGSEGLVDEEPDRTGARKAADGPTADDPLLLLERSRDLVCRLGADGVVQYVNPAVETLLGLQAEAVVGRSFLEFLEPVEVERALQTLSTALTHGASAVPGSFRFRTGDGSSQTLEVLGSMIDPSDASAGFVVNLRRTHDSFVLAEVMTSLLGGEDLLVPMRRVVDLLGWRADLFVAALVWEDHTGSVRMAGDGVLPELSGAQVDAFPWQVVRTDGRERTAHRSELSPELAALAEGCGVHTAWVVPVPVPVDVHPALLTVWTLRADVSVAVAEHSVRLIERLVALILGWHRQQDELRHAATHDALTGLANRAAFFEELARPGGADAIVYLDLDDFKPVNDRFGHAVGDRVLVAIGRRLRGAVRPGDVLARLGGDEFAVLLRGVTEQEALLAADRLAGRVAHPVVLDDRSVHVTASVGVACGTAGEPLLDLADRAQLVAKRRGGGVWLVEASAQNPPAA
jgi:diguanylate cyclase (GGDEF)-like protein/PAS domain S-box-containing protein